MPPGERRRVRPVLPAVGLGVGRDAPRGEQAHAQHARVEHDVDARGPEPRERAGRAAPPPVHLGRAERPVLHGEVAVAHDGVEGLAGLAEDQLGEVAEHGHGEAADADVAQEAVLVAQAAQLAHGGEDLGGGDELDVVGVDEVEVGGVEAPEAAQDRVADVGGGVVELLAGDAGDAAGLGDDAEAVAGHGEGLRVGRGGGGVRDGGQGGAEERLGRAVVRGRVEGGDAELDRARDDASVGHLRRVADVLVVEGRRAEDQRRQGRVEGR